MGARVHRVTSDSKRGRSMTAAKGTSNVERIGLTREQEAWNAELERKKKAKRDKNNR